MYREVAAFVLDDGFAGVPPTALAKVRHRFLRNDTGAGRTENQHSMRDDSFAPDQNPHQNLKSDSDAHTEGEEDENFYGGYKLSSVQSYVRHEGCAEDLGPCMFDDDDVIRIAVLDIRLCNLDRHGGNILICQHHPYVNSKHGLPSMSASLSSCRIYGSAESFPAEERPSDDWDSEREKEWDMNRFMIGKQSPPSSPALPLSYVGPYSPLNTTHDHDNATSTASSAPSSSTSLQIFFDRQTQTQAALPPPPLTLPQGARPRFPPKSRLVPIDHGYCLPHVLHMSDTAFIWLNWSQAKGSWTLHS
jgi:Phosphatidylinositol 3- and 4-kinase